MALEYIAYALKSGPADPVCKLLLIGLLEHANKHGVCWPSRKLLEEYTGASSATITRKLRILEVSGWIQRKQRYNSSTVFRVNLDRLERLQRQEKRCRGVPKGWEPFEDEVPEPIENKGDDHDDHTVDHTDHTVDHGEHLNPPIKPLIEIDASALTPFERSQLRQHGKFYRDGRYIEGGEATKLLKAVEKREERERAARLS